MRATILGLFLALGSSSCFVSEGDCVSRGVVVDPCVVSARAGQTIVLRASVVGAPDEPVDWILPQSAASAFEATTTENSITLVSLQNVSSSFPIQASSRVEPSVFGGSVVGVNPASFGNQAPPFVLFGGDLPVGSKAAATAAGGNLYYVAYAATGVFLGGSTNFFVKRYSLSTNALLADIPGQFALFTGTAGTPIAPNVEADCQGNGYWIDALNDQNRTIVLRRLAVGSTTPTEQPLGDATTITSFLLPSLSVSCDGHIYYLMQPFGQTGWTLFRIDAFGGAPVAVSIMSPSFIPFTAASMAIDVRGRLLIADSFGQGPPISRWIVTEGSPPVASRDASFVPQFVDSMDNEVPLLEPTRDVTVDAAGVLYFVRQFEGDQGIVALNDLGREIYTVGSYRLFCPEGCEVDCGTDVPFTDIVSLDAAPNGALRVLDDVNTGALPPECGESVRFILIDPR